MSAPDFANPGLAPCAIWSLLDMLRFKADAFVDLMEALQGTRSLLRRAVKHEPERPGFTQDELRRLRSILEKLSADAEVLGAPMAKVAADRLLESANRKKPAIDQQTVLNALDAINDRLADELSLLHVFVMDRARQKYHATNAKVFGEEVADRLPLAIPDIIDAGNCLAVNQGTASVFHSMRVMEAGLRGLGRLLDIPYAPSWESYIIQIEAKITAKHATKSVRWKRDEGFYREILGNLQTIKLTWRNPTMHIVRRYSVDEAEEIYGAVRAFLQRLAPRLPKPKSQKPTLEQLLS